MSNLGSGENKKRHFLEAAMPQESFCVETLLPNWKGFISTCRKPIQSTLIINIEAQNLDSLTFPKHNVWDKYLSKWALQFKLKYLLCIFRKIYIEGFGFWRSVMTNRGYFQNNSTASDSKVPFPSIPIYRDLKLCMTRKIVPASRSAIITRQCLRNIAS